MLALQQFLKEKYIRLGIQFGFNKAIVAGWPSAVSNTIIKKISQPLHANQYKNIIVSGCNGRSIKGAISN